MNIRKTIGLLLAAAVAAGASSMAVSAEQNDFSINGDISFIRYTEGECEVDFTGKAMTLTHPAGFEADKVGAHTMWNITSDNIVHIAQTPYLCWDISGEPNFDVVIRFAEGDKGLVSLQEAVGKTEGLTTGKGSINFLEFLQSRPDLSYDGGDLSLIATVYWLYGEPGTSVTFNQLYFSADPLGDTMSHVNSGDVPDTTTTTAGNTTTTTAAPGTTSGTGSTTTQTADTQGFPVVPVAVGAAVVAAAAVIVIVVVYRNKNRGK
jgi:hypothetical protein